MIAACIRITDNSKCINQIPNFLLLFLGHDQFVPHDDEGLLYIEDGIVMYRRPEMRLNNCVVHITVDYLLYLLNLISYKLL